MDFILRKLEKFELMREKDEKNKGNLIKVNFNLKFY